MKIAQGFLFFSLILFFSIELGAQPVSPRPFIPGATQPITIEWIYKDAEKFLYGLPKQESWSPLGHTLAYLISSATEAPNLYFFDPALNDAHLILTPRSLRNLIDGKAADAVIEEVSCASPEKSEVNIYGFDWLQDDRHFRLNTNQGTFLYNAANQGLQKMELPAGEKSNLTWSPDSHFIAYTRQYDLYAYDFDQKREIRLTRGGGERLRNGELDWVYSEELEISSGFYWSPDNNSIAYLQLNEEGVASYPLTDFSPVVPTLRSQIYPKAGTKNPSVRVGVVCLSSQETRWIDLGYPYEYIARVVWSPKGDFLAIQALNRDQNRLVLLFADPLTGSSRVILEETDPYWVNVPDAPVWLGNHGDFLWLSERDGYRHIYKVDQYGKSVRQLTRGDWEITKILKVVKENKEIFFEATKESPLERHAYCMSWNGGSIRKITGEAGTHSVSVAGDGFYVYDRFDSTLVPRRKTVLDIRGKVVRLLGEKTLADYCPYRIDPPSFFTIQGQNGCLYYAQLYYPQDFDSAKKYPVIVSVYGGPHGQVVRNGFDAGINQVWLANGFLVFSIDNRGSWGRGHDWETPIYRHFGQVELQDLQMGVDYLKTLPYVDGQRMGVWGWSFGGYFTCYALTHAPGLFRAGAAVAPVTDWRLYDSIYTERYMDTPEDNPDGYHDSSPVFFADQLQDALFLAHGTSDDNVHPQNTFQLIDSLLKANKGYTFYAYPQKNHGIWGDEYRIHLFSRMLEFFRRELSNQESAAE